MSSLCELSNTDSFFFSQACWKLSKAVTFRLCNANLSILYHPCVLNNDQWFQIISCASPFSLSPGADGVGKTSLVLRFVTGGFNSDQPSTIGCECRSLHSHSWGVGEGRWTLLYIAQRMCMTHTLSFFSLSFSRWNVQKNCICRHCTCQIFFDRHRWSREVSLYRQSILQKSPGCHRRVWHHKNGASYAPLLSRRLKASSMCFHMDEASTVW